MFENIDYTEILNIIKDLATTYLPKIVLGGIILWVGFKLIAKLSVFLDKIFNKVFDDTLRPFFVSAISFVANAVLIVAAAGIVGFNLAGLLGIFAAAAFAIGMALQGSLGNFASGILILILKPYKVDDWIQLDGKFGKVEEIGVFSTTMETPGSKTLIVPNSKITDGIVTNFSRKGMVRLEVNVTMPYAESFPKVKLIIEKAIKSIDNVLDDPKPEIGIQNFDSHSVDVSVRPFTKPEHFWQVTFDTHQAIKKAFSDNGIKVAYSEGVEMGSIGE